MENKSEKMLFELTVEEIEKIKNVLFDSEIILRFNNYELAKHFLDKVLSINVFNSSFEKTRNEYITTSNKEDELIPKTEDEFYSFIIDEYFGFGKELRESILENYYKASKHLKEVDQRIKEIESELNNLDSNEKRQVKEPVLKYFLQHNYNAKDDIIDFIKNRVINYSLNRINSTYKKKSPFEQFPYFYAFSPWSYEVIYPTMISNKFPLAASNDRNKILYMYHNDKKEFQNFLASFIEEEAVIFSIRNLFNINHFIHDKAEIINEALIAYEENKRIVFSSICVVIIESIFHEICRLFGFKEDDLLKYGFTEKVNILRDRMIMDISYEYYAFTFRLLRNRIAHGLIDSAKIKEASDLILLDLYDSVQMLDSLTIPLNQKLFFLSESIKGSISESFEYLCAYLFCEDIAVPTFYKIEEKQKIVINIIESDIFWDYVDCLWNSDDLTKQSLVYALLKHIKSFKIKTIDEKCVERFQKISIKNVSKLDKVEFLKQTINVNLFSNRRR